ncbi:MAG: homoserine kinase [Actinomycetota bacterium]
MPGSSANIGPGFDVLGMAVSVHAELGVLDARDPGPRHPIAEGRHPANLAYRAAGGNSEVWVRSSIPSGRGLGFSGAMRVGAIALGLAERAGVIGGELGDFIAEQSGAILDLAAEMEGHADNAAASLYGGVVACVESDGHVTSTSVPLAAHLVSESHLVVWVPHVQTATSESRATLPRSVSRPDAVFNLARVVQLVLALGSNDRDRIKLGVEDRLHQDHRLEKVPMSRLALDQMAGAGASGCWLSGSGPTVAALVHAGAVAAVEVALSIPELEDAGRTMRLMIDVEGLHAAR